MITKSQNKQDYQELESSIENFKSKIGNIRENYKKKNQTYAIYYHVIKSENKNIIIQKLKLPEIETSGIPGNGAKNWRVA